MKLLIVIPALNEEKGIESVIRRSLEAREYIVANSPVTEVDVTVVSDGSTDGTVDIARRYEDQIRLIVFPKNRGYGAAIKEGWRESDAELLGFLDADGTCDPRFFADLCSTAEETGSDVSLGCRLNPDTRMPLSRRVGNTLFAWLLSLFSSSRVRDTASGMRVVRQTSLPELLPLPDGLHFTPAMSARAILNPGLGVVEINMPYEERTGHSKLNAVRDGLRFLGVIVETTLLYRPSRPLALLGLLFILAAAALMAQPAFYYLAHRSVPDWMVYRFLTSHLLGTNGVLLLSAAYLSQRVVHLSFPSARRTGPVFAAARRFFASRLFWTVPLGLIILGGLLVFRAFVTRLTLGSVTEHWSRFFVMSFFVTTAVTLVGTRIIDYILDVIASEKAWPPTPPRGERSSPAPSAPPTAS